MTAAAHAVRPTSRFRAVRWWPSSPPARRSSCWSGASGPACSSTAFGRSTPRRSRPGSLAVVTTVCSAWRWRVVARGLGIRLSLRGAVAAYYRAQFLNTTLPGGVSATCTGVSPRPGGRRRRPRTARGGVGALGRAGRRVGLLTLLLVCLRRSRRVPLVALAVVAAAAIVGLEPGPGRTAGVPVGATARLRRPRPALRAARPAVWPKVVLASAVVAAGHVARSSSPPAPAGRRAGVPCCRSPCWCCSPWRCPERRRLGAPGGNGGLGICRRRAGCVAQGRPPRATA